MQDYLCGPPAAGELSSSELVAIYGPHGPRESI